MVPVAMGGRSTMGGRAVKVTKAEARVEAGSPEGAIVFNWAS